MFASNRSTLAASRSALASASCRRSLRFEFSCRRLLMRATRGSWLTTALFLMRLARWAKRSDEMDSAPQILAGVTLQIITVTALPPRLSCRRRVSLDDRYGICVTRFDVSALITFPSALSERLMFAPSRSRSPTVIAASDRSEPARSIKCSLLVFLVRPSLSSRRCCFR